jgi:biopolymer transport protein ExbD
MLRRPTKRRRNEINIVPLVDVLVVLIFFFLIMMEFRTRTVLNITPPRMESAGQSEVRERIVIGVDARGRFSYNGTAVTREALVESVRAAADLSPGEAVQIQADEATAWKDVAFVMDTCREADLNNITVQTRE